MKETLIRFTKMSGAGNDFIVMDNRDGRLPEPLENLAGAMCPRRTAVGADGLIVVEPPKGDEDFSMRYYNADGTEADLCGNGARCVARFAHELSIASSLMSFSSPAGRHRATVEESGVRVGMPAPEGLGARVEVTVGGERATALYLVVGVPHAVVFHDDVGSLDVEAEGRRIRSDKAFEPEGANVDFAQVAGESSLRIRTYERGVEAETLACGTGAVASAVAACSEGFVKMPVAVRTWGGELLRVHSAGPEGGFDELELEGPAIAVYDGAFAYRVCGP